MNRQIKFRAKRIDNHPVFWAYGYLVKTPITAEFNTDGGAFFDSGGAGRWCIITDSGVAHEVDITTLCQYVNIKDKHGKEMYDGDIVVKDGYIWFLEDGTPNYRGVVEWYYSKWNVSVESVNPNNRGMAVGESLNEEGIDEEAKSDWEVLGNIYQNPDLLSVK